eukprot:symbB.v1.2.019595.t3/scaffold1611.1/size109513/1
MASKGIVGWTDVDLSPEGQAEATAAGRLLKEKGFKCDIVFTSLLRRSVKSAWMALMELENFAMPVINSWRLNERHFGDLQGKEGEPLLAFEFQPQSPWKEAIDRYFCISLRGSSLTTELRAGDDVTFRCLEPEKQLVSGAFAAGVTCILCGVLSNLPLGLVPSVGPNVYIAYSLVGPGLFSKEKALAISAMSGLFLVLLSLTPLLRIVLGLMPLSIKYGLLVGTGLLTAFIGLKSIGVVVHGGEDIVALGDLSSIPFFISATSLVLTASLLYRAVTGAVLLGMLSSTLLAWIYLDAWPTQIVAFQGLSWMMPNFDVLNQQQAWTELGSLLLMLLFSLSGAIIGTAKMAGLLQEDGGVRGSTAVYMSSGLGTALSAFLGTSPIFASRCENAGNGLVLVGVSMTGEAREIQWWNMLDALPAFLCAIFQPFTYSVSNGIYAGVAMSSILFFTTGSFLSYIPSFQKADSVEVQEVRQMARLCSPQSAHSGPSFPICTQEEESENAPALNLMESAAELLGLDSKKMMEVVLERLDAGRNVQSHYMGGIPGYETAITDQELHRSSFFQSHSVAREVSVPPTAPTALTITDSRHPANDSHYRNVHKGSLPGSESMDNVVERMLPFWSDNIAPCVMAGKTVLVSGHASLRAISKLLEDLPDDKVPELAPGVPFVYELDANLKVTKKYYLQDDSVVKAKLSTATDFNPLEVMPGTIPLDAPQKVAEPGALRHLQEQYGGGQKFDSDGSCYAHVGNLGSRSSRPIPPPNAMRKIHAHRQEELQQRDEEREAEEFENEMKMQVKESRTAIWTPAEHHTDSGNAQRRPPENLETRLIDTACSYEISGCGCAECNGIYTFLEGSASGAPVYKSASGWILHRDRVPDLQSIGEEEERHFGWLLSKDRKPFYGVRGDELIISSEATWQCFYGPPPAPQKVVKTTWVEYFQKVAGKWKEEGNLAMKAGQFQEADRLYSEAIGSMGGVEEMESVELTELQVALLANRAEARLRL